MLLNKVWQTFLGIEHEEAQASLKSVLNKLGVLYKVERGNGSYLFDPGKESYIFFIEKYDLKIVLYSATGDPLQRILFKLLGREKELSGVAVIRVFPINKENKDFAFRLLKIFGNSLGEKLLHLDRHPRFQTAFLLKLKVQRQWKKVLNTN